MTRKWRWILVGLLTGAVVGCSLVDMEIVIQGERWNQDVDYSEPTRGIPLTPGGFEGYTIRKKR